MAGLYLEQLQVQLLQSVINDKTPCNLLPHNANTQVLYTFNKLNYYELNLITLILKIKTAKA